MSPRRFRPRRADLGPATTERLLDLLDTVWLPAHFFIASPLHLTWEFVPREQVPWEFYQGRLLDRRHCGQVRLMSGWNIYQVADDRRSGEPLLAIKVNWEEEKIHVLRGLEVYAWETFEKAGEAHEQEIRRWQRELVGSIRLSQFPDLEEARDEIICLLWQAVVGTSRLPLTSVETPLPAFSLGRLHYLFRADLKASRDHPDAVKPLRTWRDLLQAAQVQDLAESERARLLEFFLRCYPRNEAADAVPFWLGKASGDLPRLLRKMFNQVSLSPYMDFVANSLHFLDRLIDQGGITPTEAADFLAHLLRQNYHHLLAYDLVTFHHRGANYPDALLLEEVLPRFARTFPLQQKSGARSVSSRCLALVQGCLLLHRYRAHAVPDAPTSPGEQARVYPGGEQRVPQEQIEQPHYRKRLLFPDWDWESRLGPDAILELRRSLQLLEKEETFVLLGTALFIDRPFGEGKALLEPDQTLLLAQEAFSRTLANAQLARWRQLLLDLGFKLTEAEEQLLRPREGGDAPINGLSMDRVAASTRPVPSLADARRVAADFLVRRTLPGSMKAFWEYMGRAGEGILVVRLQEGNTSVIALLDAEYRVRDRFQIQPTGFTTRAGLEFPEKKFTLLD